MYNSKAAIILWSIATVHKVAEDYQRLQQYSI